MARRSKVRKSFNFWKRLHMQSYVSPDVRDELALMIGSLNKTQRAELFRKQQEHFLTCLKDIELDQAVAIAEKLILVASSRSDIPEGIRNKYIGLYNAFLQEADGGWTLVARSRSRSRS